MFTKDVKSLNELVGRDAEGWPMVDIKLDKLFQVNVSYIFSCFSILAELDFILHVFYLVRIKQQSVVIVLRCKTFYKVFKVLFLSSMITLIVPLAQ